ncbi:MAG: hypothetical protein JXQ73_31785 [Phycisphaerae bacterium]|nr:hypothetical protein [Phycisphaerae bacterium]
MRSCVLVAAGWVLLSGCTLREAPDRPTEEHGKQAEEMEGIRRQLDERQKDLSQGAAEELELRRRIAELNEQIADLREKNRHLQDKVNTSETIARNADARLRQLQADHERALTELRKANEEAMADREARTARLKERIRQLEALVARSRASGGSPSTAPGT